MTDVLQTEQRGLILCNGLGHVELSWDSQDDSYMRAVIEKKMKEGVRFFILKPLLGGALYRTARIKTMADLKESRIKVEDADIEKLFADGRVRMERAPPEATNDTVRVARTADEAVRGRSVAVPALQGG